MARCGDGSEEGKTGATYRDQDILKLQVQMISGENARYCRMGGDMCINEVGLGSLSKESNL